MKVKTSMLRVNMQFKACKTTVNNETEASENMIKKNKLKAQSIVSTTN